MSTRADRPQTLRPFWNYYGGKWRMAPRYPAPRHGRIVEPFAGAAGYSLRHADADVTLVDSLPAVAETWRYLIGASPSEIRSIPLVEDVRDLPDGLPEGARLLVGWNMNSAAATPRITLSAGNRRLAAMGRRYAGWTEARRERTAAQLERIRHWKIIEGDYTAAPRCRATWFVDPPYRGAGRHYPHRHVDYLSLGDWCKGLDGDVIVCEQVGASWLAFEPMTVAKSGPSTQRSWEAVWVRQESQDPGLPPDPTPEQVLQLTREAREIQEDFRARLASMWSTAADPREER